MDFKSLVETPLNQTHVLYAGIATLAGFILWRHWATSVHVPKYGWDIPFLYQWSSMQFAKNGRAILADGYKKYPIFKVPTTNGWLVVISGGKLAEEFAKLGDDVLSFMDFVKDSTQIEYTLGKQLGEDPWHTGTIKGTLVRNLASIFSNITHEVEDGFRDEMPANEHEWTRIALVPSMMRVIARVSNRAFVGRPLSSNPVWRDLNVTYTIDASQDAAFINKFPSWLHPIVGRYLTKIDASKQKAAKLLTPMIEDRWKIPKEERPNDLLSWYMEEAPESEKHDPLALTLRVIGTNFAAIHTTSMTFTQALYLLTSAPEYIEPLREEAQAVIEQHGWSKAGMGAMHKMDSLFRETQRLLGFGYVSMGRKSIKPFTFSDGTYIPAGTRLALISRSVHVDGSNYDEPEKFKPFRFSDARDAAVAANDIKTASSHQMVTTSMTYLPFGHGKHACPGRFFAANEMKCLMAYFILNYDWKWANESWPKGYVPPEHIMGISTSPDPTVQLLIKRRSIQVVAAPEAA